MKSILYLILSGHYCDASSLPNVAGECDPGFYCTLGAKVPNPQDNVTGNICPEGHYCEKGTYDPTPCPIGTFSASKGNKNVTGCELCTPGSFCGSKGLTTPTDVCDGGFYCPKGQSNKRPTKYICTPGHYCPANSPSEKSCILGKYQNDYEGSSCKECPEGFFCDNSFKNNINCTHGVQLPSPCVPGHYCTNGTKSSKEHPCPAGKQYESRLKYSPIMGKNESNKCIILMPKCKTQHCMASYHTLSVSKRSCLYCIGTYTDKTHRKAESECSSCPAGKFCRGTGNQIWTGECEAGYICLSGSNTSTPTDGITGKICPKGSV